MNHKLTGLRFGSMTAGDKVSSDNGAVLSCQCDCGSVFTRKATAIKKGEKLGRDQSCGCTPEYREVKNYKIRTCKGCMLSKPVSAFSKSKTSTYGLQIYCKSCSFAWRNKNKEYLQACKKKYYQDNKDKIDIKKKAYTDKNRSKMNAYWAFFGAQRRASIFRATPSWACRAKIKVIYNHASLLNCWPGDKVHVDHIVPLKSEFVCGLHCEQNLQLLSNSENSSKGNYYWPDMPEAAQ